MLAIPGVFNAPQQLQGFAADDVFSNDPVPAAETIMGVDGHLSAGFVFAPIPWHVALQADSLSNDVFDSWNRANILARNPYRANGTVWLVSLNKKWVMNSGVLVNFPTMPDAARTLRPRRFTIQWESVPPAAV